MSSFITGPRGVEGVILPAHYRNVHCVILPFPSWYVGKLIRAAALQAGFQKVDYREGNLGAFVGKRRGEAEYLKSIGDSTLLVHWTPRGHDQSLIEWVCYRNSTYGSNETDSTALTRFEEALAHQIRYFPPPPPPVPVNPVVMPGQRPFLKYEGQMVDYSPLAMFEELNAFRRGVLPLGIAAFGWEGGPVAYDKPLYLPYVGKYPAEELGVLICAPTGSGKTFLLVRWAAAAARAGRCVFLIDVKGNMRQPLEEALVKAGLAPNILHITTAPDQSSGRVNFLSGISPAAINCTEQFDSLARALMPEDNVSADDKYAHDLSITSATAAMKLLKLIQHYSPGHLTTPDGSLREPDLPDLLNLVQNEDNLMTWIDWLRELEDEMGPNALNYDVEECVNDLSIALGSQYPELKPSDSDPDELEVKPFRGGQRDRERTYRQYMLPLIMALRPFRENGPMGARSRSFGSGPEFRIQDFGKPGCPSVVLLSVRDEDSKLGESILAMAVRRLRHTLDVRRNDPGEKREVLLLLDETARIPGFSALDFVTVMRDAHVGYALVYQGLGMIDMKNGQPTDLNKLRIVLRNVGTQIYLDGIASDDLKIFNGELFQRKRDRMMPGTSQTQEGRSQNSNRVAENVEFLEEIAAHRFPAGKFPAMVYFRKGPAPFLVDRDERVLSANPVKQLNPAY